MRRAWDEMADFYLDLTDGKDTQFARQLTALADLCQMIHGCHLRDTLFGYTSMAELNISQTPPEYPLPQGFTRLRVTPYDGAHILCVYEVVQPHQYLKDWSRQVPPQDLTVKFEKFLRQLGWNYQPISSTRPQPV